MTIQEAEQFLNCIYYSIEEDDSGKFVHILGDWCYAPAEYHFEGLPYRNCEYTWLYIPIEELIRYRDGHILDLLYDYMTEVKQYEGEYSEKNLIEDAESFVQMKKLDLCDITPDTPCGEYISKWPTEW